MSLTPSNIDLTRIERRLLNALQGGFPPTATPFEALENRLGLGPEQQVEAIRSMDDEGYISRFGAVINTRALGGDSRLAAMAVPDERLEAVAERVSGHRTVTHNYVRNHELNLWFVLSAVSEARIDRTLETLRQTTDLPVYDLPKLNEYYVGLKFQFYPDGSVDTVSRPSQDESLKSRDTDPPTGFTRRLIRVIQEGLPIRRRPFDPVARTLEVPLERVLEELRGLLARGQIRRMGIVPHHYNLGIRGNGMAVFDVPDERVDRVGRRLGRRDEVTHCYRRPRHEPIWPYNLFAMVHDREPAAARDKVDRLRREEKLTEYDHEVLFSRRLLKKTGLRLD